jgi:uncharacterized protein
VASPRYILDTGPLVAFANRADSHHNWAVEVLNSLGLTTLTCEIVLAEVCYLLNKSQRVVGQTLALPARGNVLVEAVLIQEAIHVGAAVAKYWPTMTSPTPAFFNSPNATR